MLSWSRPALRISLLLTFGGLLVALPTVQARQISETVTGHVVAVTAGDAMDVRLGDDTTISVRLHGIECPTTPRALRETATRYTSRLVLDSDVRVAIRGAESNSVMYGEVYTKAGNTSVNVTLVRAGVARWSSAYAANRTDLRDAEAEAKASHSGLWGASDGSNIQLPAVNESATAPRNSSTPHKIIPEVNPAPVSSRRWHAGMPLIIGALLTFAVMLITLISYAAIQHLRWSGRRFAAQLILSLLAAVLGGVMLCVSLPAPDGIQIAPAIPSVPVLIAALLPVPALLLLRFGIQKTERAVRLRGRPVDPRQADLGFVKLQGLAQSLEGELVSSGIGNIPALYVRERLERYTAETTGGKRLKAARWVVEYDEATAVDFTITTTLGDGTGTAQVLTEENDDTPDHTARARWLPYHVARFYNDIPTDAWYATAYEGDTRTEVFFVPDGTTLTVWGNLYPPAFHEPTAMGVLPMTRVAPDGTAGSLIITDGAESRAYTGPGAPSQSLGIVAILLGCAALSGIFYAVGVGGFLAQRMALTMGSVAVAIAVILALRRVATLAQSQRSEAARNYADPLRRPATATWEQYQRRFPGNVIAPAFGD